MQTKHTDKMMSMISMNFNIAYIQLIFSVGIKAIKNESTSLT